MKNIVRSLYWGIRTHAPFRFFFKLVWDPLKTRANIAHNSRRTGRKLEIGCSGSRIPGFETLSIVGGPHIDYVLDASRSLPFEDGSFDLVYASHVLEHIPWYLLSTTIDEWRRILKPGGSLEVWTPNALLVCQAVCAAERGMPVDAVDQDGWFKFNAERNPYVWANGRLFSYGDGTGAASSPNWHRSMFTPLSLWALLSKAGFRDIAEMDRTEVRAADHGWINLGMRGRKP